MFQVDGINYYYYANGTITLSNYTVISITGFDGFNDWIKQQTIDINQYKEHYTIITDYTSGSQYFVYDNGTVTTSLDVFICQGGIPCLKQYMWDLH